MIYILDLDGTLIDSSRRHYVLMQQVLERFQDDLFVEDEEENEASSKFDAQQFMHFKADGNSGKKYLTQVMHVEENTALRIMNAWGRKIESPEMMAFDSLYEDTIPFLEKIGDKENTIIYLTARQNKDEVVKELKKLDIDKYAKEIIVVDPLKASEQKTAVVQDLIDGKKINKRKIIKGEVQKKDFIIIGDTENEQQLATDLEIRSFILNRGFRSKEYWDKHEVESHESLLELFADEQNKEANDNTKELNNEELNSEDLNKEDLNKEDLNKEEGDSDDT